MRVCECDGRRKIMDEIHSLAKEEEHELYMLKWAAKDDVNDCLEAEAEKRFCCSI